MWDIIIWTNEDAVDFVPSCWSNKDKNAYKYPIGLGQQKTRQIIYECKDLDTNYKVCSAKCIKNSIIDLKSAQRYCKKGQYTSNIESDDSDQQSATTKQHNSKEAKRKKVSDTRGETTDENESSESSENENRKKCFRLPSVTKVATSTPPSQRLGDNPSTSSMSSVMSSSSTASVDYNILKNIFKEIQDIKFTMKCIEKKVDNFEVSAATTDSLLEVEDPNLQCNFPLPCETEEDIERMEAMLQNSKNRKKMTNILYLVGGDTVTKTVNFALAKLLGKEISLKYSGQGRKQKLPFCKLAMYGVVTEALRKRHPKASDEMIKKAVSLYLATSKSRLPPSLRNRSEDRPESNN